MKKVLLAILTIPLMAVQCSDEETPTTDCNCEIVEYKYGVWQFQPDGITPIWSYKETKRTPTDLNCDSESNNYIPISGVYYYKIECE